jgi:integrase
MAYTAKRLQTHAPSTVRYEMHVLRRGFRLLERAGKAKTPMFPTITVRNTRQGFFEDHDLADVMRHLLPDLRPLVQFLNLTGWRVREATALTWTVNVDWPGGVVRLEPNTTKNDQGRTWPFDALHELRQLLVDQLAETKRLEMKLRRVIPWVFWRQPDGRQIKEYKRNWKTACRLAGCPGRLVHDLRRTAVRRLERAGVPRSVAKQLTGHKTDAIYDRYAITCEQDLRNGVAKLEQHQAERSAHDSADDTTHRTISGHRLQR